MAVPVNVEVTLTPEGVYRPRPRLCEEWMGIWKANGPRLLLGVEYEVDYWVPYDG